MTDRLDDIDQRIRDELLDATADVADVDVGRLAALLTERRESGDVHSRTPDDRARPRGRGARWLSVAAIVLAVSGVLGVLVFANRSSSPESSQRVRTSPGSSTPPDDVDPLHEEMQASDGWRDWESGWHELDLGPVPRGASYSTAWYRGRLVVAVNDYSALGDVGWTTQLWSFDPTRRSWTSLPVPHLYRIDIVATGDQLVAIGLEAGGAPNAMAPLGNRWSIWTMGEDTWVDRGPLPRASGLEATGVTPVGPDGSPLLVWTGRVLLDFTRGQIINPSSGGLEPLALPEDLAEFRTLLSTRPVWTGAEVVWPERAADTGLVWSPAGDEVRSVEFDRDDPDHANEATKGATALLTSNVFAVGGHVIVVDAYSGGEPFASYGEVVVMNPDGYRSAPVDRIDDLPVPGCLVGATTEDERLLIVPCARDDRFADAVMLDGDRWLSIGAPPDASRLANAARQASLISAGRSAVLFSALVPGDWLRTDRSGEEWVPRAAVWKPDR